MTEIHSPPNEGDLDEVFIFCSVDEAGKRGIVAHILGGLGSTPFVTSSPTAIEVFKSIAPEVASATGKRVVMTRYRRGEDVWSTED